MHGLCRIGVWLTCYCAVAVYTLDQASNGYLPDEMMCPQNGDTFLQQVQIPWGLLKRAWQSIPPGVEVVTSNIPENCALTTCSANKDTSFTLATEAGLGVMATRFIPAGTWLAEYEGLIVTSEVQVDSDTTYTWSVTRNNTAVYDIDAGHISTSNWLRWINCARTATEENVECCLCYGRIYYRALKDIAPGEELLVYYGDEYAEELGIDTSSFIHIGEELEFITELIDNSTIT